MFSARPNMGFTVDTWDISGADFAEGSKIQGSNTATVTVKQQDINVTVSFKALYKQVDYNGFDDYLKTASETEVHYIELTGTIPPQYFKGPKDTQPGTLGETIKKHSTKKLALKLPETVNNLTDMTGCFYGCTNLVSLLNVPKSATNMKNSFYNCTNLETAPELPADIQNLESCFGNCSILTKAPVIPEKVINLSNCFEGCTQLQSVTLKCKCPTKESAFENAFLLCTALGDGSIKVPADQLKDYQAKAKYMTAQESCFTAEGK